MIYLRFRGFWLTDSFLKDCAYLKTLGMDRQDRAFFPTLLHFLFPCSRFSLGLLLSFHCSSSLSVSSLLGSQGSQVSLQWGICSLLASLGSLQCSFAFYTQCCLILVGRKWYILLFGFVFSSSKNLKRKWRQDTVWSEIPVQQCKLQLAVNAFACPFLSLTPLVPCSSSLSPHHLFFIFVIASPFFFAPDLLRTPFTHPISCFLILCLISVQ